MEGRQHFSLALKGAYIVLKFIFTAERALQRALYHFFPNKGNGQLDQEVKNWRKRGKQYIFRKTTIYKFDLSEICLVVQYNLSDWAKGDM